MKAEDNLKICPACNAINDVNSEFCRNCGEKFEQTNLPTPVQPVNQTEQQYNSTENQNSDLISEVELVAFVGPNVKNFIPKFRKAATGKSTGWNWPVFLFAFFFGPIAAGFWFLHRRMNKIGAIVVALGVVFSGVSLALAVSMTNIITNISGQAIEQYQEEFGSYNYQPSDEEIEDFTQNFVKSTIIENSESMAKIMIILLMLFIIKILVSVVLALFADNLYYKFCCQRINEIKHSGENYNFDTIAKAGGVKTVGWVVCLISYVVVTLIISTVISINVVSQIMQYINY